MPVKKVQSSKLPVRRVRQAHRKQVQSSIVRKITKAASKVSRFNLPVFNIAGKRKGSIELPMEIFGAKVNEKLLAQAVRVYLVNQRQGTASTKTRGEVVGSTRKIYRQKGTGRARHGSIKAPIFVGGGIIFGPKPRKFELKLSKQMKKKALFSALSQKFFDQKISVVDPAGANGKTKEFVSLFNNLDLLAKKERGNLVLYVSDSSLSTKRAAKNIRGVTVSNVQSINTYEVLANRHLVFENSAVSNLVSNFLKKGKNL